MATGQDKLLARGLVEEAVTPRRVSNLIAVAVAAMIGFTGNELVTRYRILVAARSAQRRWSPTGCMPAPTGSPR
jgi:hypothetical protein